jgi:hypothetical protein
MCFTDDALPKWCKDKHPTDWVTNQTDQVEVNEVGGKVAVWQTKCAQEAFG